MTERTELVATLAPQSRHYIVENYAIVLLPLQIQIFEFLNGKMEKQICQKALPFESCKVLCAVAIAHGVQVLLENDTTLYIYKIFFNVEHVQAQASLMLTCSSRLAVHLKNNFVFIGDANVTSFEADSSQIIPKCVSLPSYHKWQIAPFDSHHVIIYGSTFAAFLFNVTSQELKPYPLYVSLDENMALLPVGKKMICGFGKNQIFIMNKVTRAIRVLPFSIHLVNQAVELPKVEGQDYSFLICSTWLQYMVRIPERYLQEDFGTAVKRDMEIVTASSKLQAHKAVFAARIPHILQDEKLLDWSFASDAVCKKVIYYLYSGELLSNTSSSDLEQIEKVANYIKDATLANFCSTLQGGDTSIDAKMNKTFNKIAISHHRVKSHVEEIIAGFSHYYKAYYSLTISANSDTIEKRINDAIVANPHCLQYQRLRNSILKHNTVFEGAASLVNKNFAADIVFQVHDEMIYGHLYYLAKSPFIKEMMELNEDVVMKINLTIVLPEITVPILLQILKFAYANVIDLPSAISDLQVLHKCTSYFGFPDIEEACEEKIIEAMNPSNAQELLEFAMQHNCTRLFVKCQHKLSAEAKLQANKDYELPEYDQQESKSAYIMYLLDKFKCFKDSSVSSVYSITPQITITNANTGSYGTVFCNYGIRINAANRIRLQFTLDVGNITELAAPIISVALCSNAVARITNDNYSLFGFRLHCASSSRSFFNHFTLSEYQESSKLEVQMVMFCAKQLYPEMDETMVAVVSSINNSAYELCFVRCDPNVVWHLGISASNNACSNSVALSQLSIECNVSKRVFDQLDAHALVCGHTSCGKTFSLLNNSANSCVMKRHGIECKM